MIEKNNSLDKELIEIKTRALGVGKILVKAVKSMEKVVNREFLNSESFGEMKKYGGSYSAAVSRSESILDEVQKRFPNCYEPLKARFDEIRSDGARAIQEYHRKIGMV